MSIASQFFFSFSFPSISSDQVATSARGCARPRGWWRGGLDVSVQSAFRPEDKNCNAVKGV